jgi:hypothetical protein
MTYLGFAWVDDPDTGPLIQGVSFKTHDAGAAERGIRPGEPLIQEVFFKTHDKGKAPKVLIASASL